MASPRIYATFLLWLISELFEELPEVGDLDKPKLVFFFDEAHLLFEEAPRQHFRSTTEGVPFCSSTETSASPTPELERVVRLIRSKGRMSKQERASPTESHT